MPSVAHAVEVGYSSESSEEDEDYYATPVAKSEEATQNSDLRLLEQIGKGGHGIVYRAIWQGRLVAAKVVELDSNSGARKDNFFPYDLGNTIASDGEQGQINGALMEGAMSLIMQHPNIVRSLGYEVVPNKNGNNGQDIHLLMEFCDRGSLLRAIEDGCFDLWVGDDKMVNMRHLLRTLMEVAYAMQHLHSMHILHRDLKIQNILLKSSNRDRRGFTVKVSDFGLAKIWNEANGSPSERQKYVGTVTHMPPEQIERGETSRACDVYAFGILMWECYNALPVYKGLIPPQVVMGVAGSQLRPNFTSSTPSGYVVRPCTAAFYSVVCPAWQDNTGDLSYTGDVPIASAHVPAGCPVSLSHN